MMTMMAWLWNITRLRKAGNMQIVTTKPHRIALFMWYVVPQCKAATKMYGMVFFTPDLAMQLRCLVHMVQNVIYCMVHTVQYVAHIGSKSKHLKGRSVPPCAGRFCPTKDFVVFLFPDTFQVVRWPPVRDGFAPTKDFVIFLFPDTFQVVRCPPVRDGFA